MLLFPNTKGVQCPPISVLTLGVQRNSRGRRTTHPARKEVVSDPVFTIDLVFPVITTKAGGAGFFHRLVFTRTPKEGRKKGREIGIERSP